MCGATQQQQDISNEQQQFYQQLTNEYSTIFGENQGIIGALTSAYMPILQAGPSQQGYSAQELQALNTQNTEGVATDYAQAQKATAQQLAARGGGDTLLPSSVNANLMAQNTNAAAAQRAQGENQITQANWNQGYQNWQQAANVLGSTAGLINPNSYSSSATGAGSAASTTANQIAQANFAPWGAAVGALGSVAGGFATGYGSQIAKGCWIAAELYGGWEDPRTILVRAWLWDNFREHWLYRLYLRFGERVAGMVRRHKVARKFFTFVFNNFLRRAQADSGERGVVWQTIPQPSTRTSN